MNNKISVADLSAVPKTMLFTLYSRMCEAKHPNSFLHDPEAIRIAESIDFDFAKHFSHTVTGAIACRAASFDRILKAWLKAHPHGQVVSLGEGLETQRQRVDNGTMRWLSIDLPEAIILREKFLPPTERFKSLAQSAFDFSWMNEIDPSMDLFVVAQGLFMYFEEAEVRKLVSEIFKRFPKAQLLFDFVPKSFVQETKSGFRLSKAYRLPPMGWGIGASDVEKTLRNWLPKIGKIKVEHYDLFARGMWHFIMDRLVRKITRFGDHLPGFAYIVGR